MGLSQSNKNKFDNCIKNLKKKSNKCTKSIKKKFKGCYISCCMPIILKTKRKNSEEIVNQDVELKEIKSENPDVKLINCKLDKKTPSLNSYINSSYIRSKSDSSIEKTKNNITLSLNEAV